MSPYQKAASEIVMDNRLTAGERKVAERVAEGRRNDEIAAELGVSPRTVEWHLTNVYRKLRVRSRTELVLRTVLMRRGSARDAGGDRVEGESR